MIYNQRRELKVKTPKNTDKTEEWFEQKVTVAFIFKAIATCRGVVTHYHNILTDIIR
jgi:hypothetical protein